MRVEGLRDLRFGGMAEWLKAADCKSARVAYVGSNPTPSTTFVFFKVFASKSF